MTWTSRPKVLLGALALAVFQVGGSLGAADEQLERKGMDALAVVLVLLGPAALAAFVRRPVIAAAVAMAAADVFIGFGYPYGPVFVSVIVSLVLAVQSGERVATVAVAAIGYVGFVVAHTLDPRSDEVGVVQLSLVAGWLAVVLAVSELVRVRRERAADASRAVEEERRRRVGEQRLALAQELHDVLAHNISMINVQAGVALHLLDEQPDQARPALTSIKEASREALHELRTALDLLRRGADEGAGDSQALDAPPLAPAPRVSDLERLVAGVRAGGLDVELQQDAVPHPLPAAVELAAYRIAQEALTNVARHAHASHVTVRVGYADGVTVEVLDDGVGGAVTAGNGITGMRERAAALGGTLDAGPRAGGGFRVAARLPLEAS